MVLRWHLTHCFARDNYVRLQFSRMNICNVTRICSAFKPCQQHSSKTTRHHGLLDHAAFRRRCRCCRCGHRRYRTNYCRDKKMVQILYQIVFARHKSTTEHDVARRCCPVSRWSCFCAGFNDRQPTKTNSDSTRLIDWLMIDDDKLRRDAETLARIELLEREELRRTQKKSKDIRYTLNK